MIKEFIPITISNVSLKFYNITNQIFNEKLFNSEILIFIENGKDFEIIQNDEKLFEKFYANF